MIVILVALRLSFPPTQLYSHYAGLICSFSKYFLSTYHMSEILLAAGDIEVGKAENIPGLIKLAFHGRGHFKKCDS